MFKMFKMFKMLNNKLFSRELKYLIMMDYGKIKRFSDENQRFDWIKSIH